MEEYLTPKNIVKIAGLTIGGILLLIVLLSLGSIMEGVDADEIMVLQDPIDGELHVFTTAGLKWQWFGTCTHYQKAFQFWFSKLEDEGEGYDQSIPVRFNDGGEANISGSARIIMPMDEKSLTDLHMKFGSQEAIQHELIRQTIVKAVYMSGPLMSSAESYAEKRNYLIQYIEDQASRGIYRTLQREEKTVDPITGEEKTITVVEILIDAETNLPKRQDSSPLQEFGVRMSNLAINAINYDKKVEAQISKQQDLKMEVMTSIATARQAEQQALTVEKQGQAAAAQAKWKAEESRARAVVEAEQRRDVAKLDAETAHLRKQEQILLGQGEAERKKLVMRADGALDKKLQAWLQAQQAYATAMAGYKGAWVPSIVMGGEGGGAGNGAQAFMDFFMLKAARDLSLDMSVPNR